MRLETLTLVNQNVTIVQQTIHLDKNCQFPYDIHEHAMCALEGSMKESKWFLIVINMTDEEIV